MSHRPDRRQRGHHGDHSGKLKKAQLQASRQRQREKEAQAREEDAFEAELNEKAELTRTEQELRAELELERFDEETRAKLRQGVDAEVSTARDSLRNVLSHLPKTTVQSAVSRKLLAMLKDMYSA